jgi:quercetin dioxygenase-like cupin family protein
VLQRYCEATFPVVAQRVVLSERLSLPYWTATGATTSLTGSARVRSFFLRSDGAVDAAGTHVTVSTGAGVSEGTHAAQAPIVFAGTGM